VSNTNKEIACQARQHYRAALRHDPTYFPALTHLGRLLHTEAAVGVRPSAKSASASVGAEGDGGGKGGGEVWDGEGAVGAEACFDLALRLMPLDPETLVAYALLLLDYNQGHGIYLYLYRCVCVCVCVCVPLSLSLSLSPTHTHTHRCEESALGGGASGEVGGSREDAAAGDADSPTSCASLAGPRTPPVVGQGRRRSGSTCPYTRLCRCVGMYVCI